MTKSFQISLLTIMFIILIAHGEQSIRYYLSYSSMTLYQVQDTLDMIVPTISIPQTTLTKAGGYNLTLTNIVVTLTYLKSFQNIETQCEYCVNVTNGRVQANFRFNFSRSQPGTSSVKGWGQGFKFVSEDVNYFKCLEFDIQGVLHWKLSKQIVPVLLFNGKRNLQPQTLYPFNQADLDIINYMFTSNESVTPASILSQLNKFISPAFTNRLKQSLNPPQLIGMPYYTYTFNHPLRGNWTMNTEKYLYSLEFNYYRGLQIGYLLQIKDFQQDIWNCKYSKMPNRLDQNIFGGQQAIYHNCMIEQIVLFMHRKGWLSLELDQTWGTTEFAFTVKDFAKIVPSLLNKFSSTAPIKGTCESLPLQPNKILRQLPGLPKYAFVLDHTCELYVSQTDQHISPELFLQFTSKVQIIVDISQNFNKMGVYFAGSELINLTNHKVKDYQINQAAFIKYFDNVLDSLIGTRLFGDGFAMLKSKKQQTRAFDTYVVYSDMNLMESEEKIAVQ